MVPTIEGSSPRGASEASDAIEIHAARSGASEASDATRAKK